MAISHQPAQDMSLVLKYGTANQSAVSGLNKMTIPGFSRTIVEVQEFREAISRQFTTGGKLGNISAGGNYVLGDEKGQDQIKSYWIDNEQFTDARIYLNSADFIACDLVQDSTSAMQVAEYTPGEADVNGIIPISIVLVMNGRPATYDVHLTATAATGYELTYVLTTGADDTITDAASRFVSSGFKAGDTLLIEVPATGGLATVTGVEIKTVAEGTLTLNGEGLYSDGEFASGVILHAGSL